MLLPFRRWRPLLLGMPISAALVASCSPLAAQEWGWFGRRNCNNTQTGPRKYNPYELSTQAAASLAAAKNQQITNGDILNRTLWSYHFELVTERDELTDQTTRYLDLHPLGKAELSRIARRNHMTPGLVVFVENAFNPNFRGTAQEELAAREKTERERVKLVEDYLRIVLKREDANAYVITPTAVGMDAHEALVAFRQGLRAFNSTLPPRQLNRFDATGGGGGDFGIQPQMPYSPPVDNTQFENPPGNPPAQPTEGTGFDAVPIAP